MVVVVVVVEMVMVGYRLLGETNKKREEVCQDGCIYTKVVVIVMVIVMVLFVVMVMVMGYPGGRARE